MERRMVKYYRRFGKAFWSHLQGSSSQSPLALKDGTRQVLPKRRWEATKLLFCNV